MTEIEILEYNRRCADFIGFKKHANTEEQEKWYAECYPDLPSYRKAYQVPLNFPFRYEHPTLIHAMYNNPEEVPVQTQRVPCAKLRFHSDWNWIMKVVEAIEKISDWSIECLNLETRNYQVLIPLSNTNVVSSDKKEAIVQAIDQFLIAHAKDKSNR